MLDEGVVLLGSAFGEGLEPVGIVRHAVLLGPLHHAFGHGIGHGAFELCTIVHHVDHLLIDVLGQVLVHLFAVEHFLAKVLCRSLGRCCHVERFLLESFANNLES